MATIGYARVSTKDQDCALQVAALKAAGCDPVRQEQRTGTTMEGRAELDTIMQFLRAGDVLVVTRVDRLARSLGDLISLLKDIEDRGAHLRVLEQTVDTTTASGRAFFHMLGVFSEFETAIRRERQAEGIAEAKARGVYKGAVPTVDVAKVRQLKSEGVRPVEIARRLGIGRASVYRALAPD